MYSYAQTNIQLFNQLRIRNYSEADLKSIFKIYELTMNLFNGCYRPSGKTFIAHLIGTASILASLDVPINVVAAGLIHAAYSNGQFGDGEKGISEKKRAQLREVVGEEIEEYVARYQILLWKNKTIPTLHEGMSELSPIDRDVLLIRLANELEEYLDRGILYCGEQKLQRYIKQALVSGHLIVEMADKLGFPVLASELAKAFKEASLPAISITNPCQGIRHRSFVIPPKSLPQLVSSPDNSF